MIFLEVIDLNHVTAMVRLDKIIGITITKAVGRTRDIQDAAFVDKLGVTIELDGGAVTDLFIDREVWESLRYNPNNRLVGEQ